MGHENSERKNLSFLALKAKVDEANEPYFALSEKVDNVWKETGRFDTVFGMITGAKIEEKEFKDGKKKFFVLFLEDDKGTSKVAMSHNQVTYGIINSLASCANKISEFSIKVYRAKPEVKDNKTYYNGRSFVQKEKQKTEWHISPTDAPKKVPVMVGPGKPFLKDGKQVYDSSEQESFWEKIFTTCIVDKVGTGEAVKPPTQESHSGTTGAPFVADDSDLPF